MDDVLFLIPARSGSKGVANKNLKKLFDIPLLAIRGLSAFKLTQKGNVWLSTDSQEYANIGMNYGLNVPFLRPEHLATDQASSVDVVLHAMEYAQANNRTYKFVALLEPTSPFVYTEYIEDAINTLKRNEEARAIVATKIVETSTVFIQKKNKYLDVIAKNIEGLSIRRQDFEPEVTPSGGFYIARWDEVKLDKTFYTDKTLSYVLPDICALEIDSELQYHWAEFLVKQGAIDKTKIF